MNSIKSSSLTQAIKCFVEKRFPEEKDPAGVVSEIETMSEEEWQATKPKHVMCCEYTWNKCRSWMIEAMKEWIKKHQTQL